MSCFIQTGQDMNGSLSFRHEVVMGPSPKYLKGESQSEKSVYQKGNETSEVKIKICSQTHSKSVCYLSLKFMNVLYTYDKVSWFLALL